MTLKKRKAEYARALDLKPGAWCRVSPEVYKGLAVRISRDPATRGRFTLRMDGNRLYVWRLPAKGTR